MIDLASQNLKFHNFMTSQAQRRLLRDFSALQDDPPQGINASPVGGDLMLWQAIILGPGDSYWEGGTFKLSLIFTEEYPNKPPKG